MGWKVIATQEGQHNQIFREVGEVFDLMTYPDGTYPPQIEYLPKKDKSGKVIEDEYDEKIIQTATLDGKGKEPAHRDFAEDRGNIKIKRGPKKGEVMRFGWMLRVPDATPVGFWAVDEGGNVPDFRAGIPMAAFKWARSQYLPEDPRRAHAKINHGPYLAPEPEEEAA